MRASDEPARRPANDAGLIQAARTVLGRDERLRGEPKINVSSCSFVVSLHGSVADPGLKEHIERMVLGVSGVAGMKNELKVPDYPVLGVREKG